MWACLNPTGSVFGGGSPQHWGCPFCKGWVHFSFSHLSIRSCIFLRAPSSPNEPRQVLTLLRGFHAELLSLTGQKPTFVGLSSLWNGWFFSIFFSVRWTSFPSPKLNVFTLGCRDLRHKIGKYHLCPLLYGPTLHKPLCKLVELFLTAN